MSQQNVTLHARGLYSFPNTLSEVPDGALSAASNVVIDRDGVVNPRRGIKLYGDDFGTISDRAKQLLLYKGRILRHWNDELDVDSDGEGTFTVMDDMAGDPAIVNEVETGVRIKYVEANGNLYFTTSQGIYKISCLDVADIATRPVTAAGGVKALDGYATLNPTTGWFTEDSIVAYRVVWGIKDENTNVILGAPSERIIIANSLLSLLIQDYNDLVSDLSVVAAFSPIVQNGDINNSTVITNLSDTSNLSVGMSVSDGMSIDPASVIVSVDSSTQVTISEITTGGPQTVSITFDQQLHDTDYASLKISINSSATTLYNALKALANGASNKLDNDMGGTTFQNIPLTPSSEPDEPTPTGELIEMQEYFDNIINELNATEHIATAAKEPIGDAFSNSTESATVDLTFSIPTTITTAHFYQIYRSALFSSTGASTLEDIQPDDELNLIFEDNPSDAEIAAKSVTFFDNIPDSFRQGGANLYTNANSGEGIAQANTPPPLALDIASFKNSTFYANTSTLYKVQIGLLTAVGLSGGKIYIAQDDSLNDYTFVDSVAQVTTITCVAGSDFVDTGTSDYFDIYAADDSAHYRVWFQVDTSVAPSAGGATLVECPILTGDTDDQVATKLANTLTSLTEFIADPVTNTVIVTNENTGYTTDPTENVADADFTIVVTTIGTGEQISTRKVGVSDADTPAQAVDETARSLVRVINQNANEVVNCFYVSGVNDLPGLILLEARQIGDSTFYIVPSSDTISEKFNPDLKSVIDITNISVDNPTEITSTAHGLVTGDQVVIIGTNSTPVVDGIWEVTKLTDDVFTIDIEVTVMGTAGKWIKTLDATQGDNEVVPNRIYYSKYQQPEAVPVVNYQDVGPRNKRILRILPLRESLFILTEAGVYRLAGDTPANFQITLFDSSTQIKAVDSAVVLNNQIYMFSSQGIATISDTGISIISRPIENLLLPLVSTLYPAFPTATFAVSYESDRAYILFTVHEMSDDVATIAYRYNTFTNTWVSWDVSKTCGVINADQDKMYLGAGDTNYIEVERKDFTRLDYVDREIDLTVPANAVEGDILSLGGIIDIDPGDAFVQTQYLTIEQLNRLLLYIDTDPGGADKDYYDTLVVSEGANLRTRLTSLATKLDSDAGFAYTDFASDIAGFDDSFVETQEAYNVIVTDLIADVNSIHKNYSMSNGTVEYEVVVTAVNNNALTITLAYSAPIIQGPIVLFKKIHSLLTWIPHHFGDPSMMKQVSEGTVLFETVAFSNAEVSYSSDLSTGFQSIPVVGEGSGIWGGFNWGQTVIWGGEGSSRPFRTFIPRDKQRCRYINGKFEHEIAFENYAIFGISYTFSPISSRGYR